MKIYFPFIYTYIQNHQWRVFARFLSQLGRDCVFLVSRDPWHVFFLGGEKILTWRKNDGGNSIFAKRSSWRNRFSTLALCPEKMGRNGWKELVTKLVWPQKKAHGSCIGSTSGRARIFFVCVLLSCVFALLWNTFCCLNCKSSGVENDRLEMLMQHFAYYNQKVLEAKWHEIFYQLLFRSTEQLSSVRQKYQNSEGRYFYGG